MLHALLTAVPFAVIAITLLNLVAYEGIKRGNLATCGYAAAVVLGVCYLVGKIAAN